MIVTQVSVKLLYAYLGASSHHFFSRSAEQETLTAARKNGPATFETDVLAVRKQFRTEEDVHSLLASLYRHDRSPAPYEPRVTP